MITKIFAVVIILGLAFLPAGYAFDWVALHTRAETADSEEARTRAGAPEQSPEELYLAGLVYLREYNHAEAGRVFDEIARADPDNTAARWGKAEVLRRAHRLSEAAALCEEVIARDARFAPAYLTLGYIKYLEGSFAEAARLSSRVINLPRDALDTASRIRAHGLYAGAKGLLAHYGGPLSKAVNHAAVVRHLNLAKHIDEHSPVVAFGYGTYYMFIPSFFGRDLGRAEKYLRKAIESDPQFPDAYVRLAQVYGVRGDREKYEEYLARALSLDPGNELALDIKNGTCRFICLGPPQ